MRNYKNIHAYKLADKLAVEIYKLTQSFPKHEIYGLTSQLRRSAVSIAANIVEGANRQHLKDYLNFLFIARGSLAEAEYLLNLALQLNYLTTQEHVYISKYKNDAAKTLFGLINSVKKETER